MVKKRVSTCALNTQKKSFKLFGVDIHTQSHESSETTMSSSETPKSAAMRKSKSAPGDIEMMDQVDAGPKAQERKRGVPWTEEEHKKFLIGLKKLGRGNWTGISKNYVHSRTAIQVASHAQKHFMRENMPDKRNCRRSLFDTTLNEPEISNSTPPEPQDNTKEKVPKLVDIMHALKMSQKNVNEEQVENRLALDMSPNAINVEQAAPTPLPATPVLPRAPCYGVPNPNVINVEQAAPTSLPATPVLQRAPCYGVPNPNQFPHMPMMVMANNGQIYFMGKSYQSSPMMYFPNPAFSYMQKSPGYQAPTSLIMPNYAHGSSSITARP